MTDNSTFQSLLCDLDDTLYPPHAGLMKAVGDRISRYMVERVGIPPDVTQQLRRHYHDEYGTSMRGLIVNHSIDPESYLGFVHDLPLEQYIQPSAALDEMLTSIPLRKVIFTNASREHARRVLNVLGVQHHFERIIDVRDFGFHSKPHPLAYQRGLQILGACPPQCIIIDDSARNLAPAKEMGMTAVLVGDGQPPDARRVPGAVDLHIENILGLADAIQPLLASSGSTSAPGH